MRDMGIWQNVIGRSGQGKAYVFRQRLHRPESGSEVKLIQSEVAALFAPLDFTLERKSMFSIGTHT